MPVSVMVGLLALLFAIVLYTIGTWGAFRRKGFTTRLLTFLWLGLFFDIVATVSMGWTIGGLDLRPGMPTVHTVVALVAMAGMAAGAAVGTYALASKNEALGRTVAYALLAPWALWVGVFVWGLLTRGPSSGPTAI